MSDFNEENLKFDDDSAIAFIRKYIPQNVSDQYSDDEILFVVDTIWDFYESKGVVRLNEKLTENEENHISDLVDYVRKEIKKDEELMMDPEDVEYIVKGELAYEESIEMFDD